MILALALCALVPPAWASGGDFTALALSGQAATNAGAGVVFQDLFQGYPPVMNSTGQVFFTAVLSGTGVDVTNDYSVWVGVPGSLQMIVREGDTAPGTAAEFDGSFSSNEPVLSDSGRVMFDAGLTGAGVTSTNNRGIWIGLPGALSLAVRTGDPAPGLGGGVFVSSLLQTSGSYHALTPGGHTAMNLLLAGAGVSTGNDVGIFAGTAGSLSLVAREGSAAPGTTAQFGDLFNSVPVMNEFGAIAFEAKLTGTGVTTTNDMGVWFGPPSSLSLAVREGQPAPELSGVHFAFFNRPAINSSGTLAFSAALGGSGVGTTNDFSIWAGPVGALRMVAREGSAAPGTTGALFGDFLSVDPYLNDRGEVAFNTTLSGPSVNTGNDSGIWAGAADTLRLVAREGDPAPGTPAGVIFGDFRYYEPVLSAAGQVAFGVTLFGPGVTSVTDMGIWMTDPAGDLQLLVREGDIIEVAPGDSRTVRQLKGLFGGGQGDGGSTALNRDGQLAFAVIFSDYTTGVLIAHLATPPTLTIIPDIPGNAKISWTPASTNWVLQESVSLSPANWVNSPSGATNPIVVPATLPAKFYRLSNQP